MINNIKLSQVVPIQNEQRQDKKNEISSAKNTAETDVKVDISSDSELIEKMLLSSSEETGKKIEALRLAIDNGGYQIDDLELANAIINHAGYKTPI